MFFYLANFYLLLSSEAFSYFSFSSLTENIQVVYLYILILKKIGMTIWWKIINSIITKHTITDSLKQNCWVWTNDLSGKFSCTCRLILSEFINRRSITYRKQKLHLLLSVRVFCWFLDLVSQASWCIHVSCGRLLTFITAGFGAIRALPAAKWRSCWRVWIFSFLDEWPNLTYNQYGFTFWYM